MPAARHSATGGAAVPGRAREDRRRLPDLRAVRTWPTRWRRRLQTDPPPSAGRSPEAVERDLLARLLTPVSGRSWVGWVVALVVAALAAVLRLVHLDRPGRLVFDETYYVKQAYSLLALGYEGVWNEDADSAFEVGDFSDLNPQADYVVHPPLGKWMIALGMRLVGVDNPVGWRFGAAIVGALSVLMLVRIGRRLFNSTLLGAVAGLLLAVDGVHLVMSRISILDIFLQFWIVAAFGALLLDRDSHRRRLARTGARELTSHGGYAHAWGPPAGMRWWLLAAGVLGGLGTGVKWSGIYAVAVFGVFAVAWSISARHAIGVRFWAGSGVLRDGAPAFFTMVPAAAAAYLATWANWFAHPESYNRYWARDVNAVAAEPVRTWLPDALNSLWEYHLRMWDFHTGLTSEHTYQAHPAGWLIQWRPTSFAWRTLEAEDGAREVCGAEKCAAAITSLGNPVIWWGAALALVLVLWSALVRRDWRAWAILAGYLATYAPWLLYTERTIFTFYTVALVPFVVLALTYALGELLGPASVPLPQRRPGIWVATLIVVLALAVSAWFWPVWTNQWVPYSIWHLHMWLPNWV
ncbi:dolichyl-phosphate-mannose--protein mannosyltransferase [Pseudactinotalea sp. Z1732]|uniref:dolichyl-phosphate-mannose--protein mannosyltransferase n=1 Tax=Pseudactinotalea sp. Z1732 TaxID=3413026 RepID=UPI003C7B44B3